jgi:CDP-glucose 4,6-dehydratase
MFGDLYRGRRVFVTGHTGFKGSWLTLWLHHLGAEVHGFALEPPTTPSLYELAGLDGLLASDTIGDVRDSASLAGAMRACGPEIVFHLAAQPLVRRSYADPRETFETNVMGTVNVLEAVRAVPAVRVCQIVTSDKCYENDGRGVGFRESDRIGGGDPYSSSKGCAELVVSSYARSQLLPADVCLSSVRAGNVIGAGDWAEDRIVPDCVRAHLRGAGVVLRNPAAVRPWQHVLEPLAGYLHLAARQRREPRRFAGAWNFGPLESGHCTVAELAAMIGQAWGADPVTRPAATVPPGPAEAPVLRLDVTKARERLGWRPVLSLPEAVERTVRGYRRQASRPDAAELRETCLSDIASY